MKPGYLTTEFWATVATSVLGLVLSLASMFGHVIDPSSLNALVPVLAVVASSVSVAVYNHTRGKVKAAALAASRGGVLPSGGIPRV